MGQRLNYCTQNKRRRFNDREEDEPQQQEKPDDKLKNATTLYVGNLYATMQQPRLQFPLLTNSSSFYTTEEQIHELFAK